jgi:hypothetical protein
VSHNVGNLFDGQGARPYERNKLAFAAVGLDEGPRPSGMAEGATGSMVSGCRARCEMRPTCQS